MTPDAMPDDPEWAGKDKDEPFDVKKYMESRKVPEDNGATLYFCALAEVDGVMDFVYPPKEWKLRYPKVIDLEKDIDEVINPEKIKAGLVSLEEIERVLKKGEIALAKVDEAQQKKRTVFITGMRLDSLLPHGMAARRICDLDSSHIYVAQAKDNFAEAEHSITRSLRLARDMRPRGCLVIQLVSFAMEKQILESIIDYSLKQKGLKTEQCDRLLTLLADRQRYLKPALIEGMKADYIGARNTINDLQTGRLTADKFVEYLNNINIKITKEDLGEFNYPVDIAAINRVYSFWLSEAAKPFNKLVFTKFDETEVPKLKQERAVLTLLQVPPMLKLFVAHNRIQATLSGTQCLIAVRRYVLAHDKLPKDLATAVGETELKTVPLDPFDGKPMRYRIVDEKPVVYSIGPDQKDDKALMEWTEDMPSGDLLYRLAE